MPFKHTPFRYFFADSYRISLTLGGPRTLLLISGVMPFGLCSAPTTFPNRLFLPLLIPLSKNDVPSARKNWTALKSTFFLSHALSGVSLYLFETRTSL